MLLEENQRRNSNTDIIIYLFPFSLCNCIVQQNWIKFPSHPVNV